MHLSLFSNICTWLICLCLSVSLVCSRTADAQELFCTVQINAGGSGQMDKSVFDQMKRDFTDFLNLRRRSNDNFSPEERIICNLVINITSSPRSNFYEATAQVQAVRPVYGASLETVMLNYLDNSFQFEYVPGQPMEFNDNSPQYTDNLTSLLSFYAYMIMGIDYDSFSKLGGRVWYNRAQAIALNAANQDGYKGWKAFEGTNNRNWLIENYQNQQLLPFREGLYNYHRQGLDVFEKDPTAARAQVQDMLVKIKNVIAVKPLCIAVNTWMDSKSTEIVNIFAQASPQEKQAAYNILTQIDPTKTERYQAMIK